MKHLETYFKRLGVILPVSVLTLFLAFPQHTQAQVAIAEVIKAGVKKVVKAVDLKVQRLQNKTIWLQQAQKTLENQLSKLKLEDIAQWTERQKTLYAQYYKELWEVKSAITYMKHLKELVESQSHLLNEYQWAWGLLSRDTHFSPEELLHMQEVYAGMLQAGMQHVEDIRLVVHSFGTQMSDAARLKIIHQAGDNISETLSDLRRFNHQNMQVSLQRAASLSELHQLQKLYGIQSIL